MLPDWIPPAALLGLCAIVWAEIRSLRSSRHEHNEKLARFDAKLQLVSYELSELRDDVRQIGAAIGVQPRVGGQQWNPPA